MNPDFENAEEISPDPTKVNENNLTHINMGNFPGEFSDPRSLPRKGFQINPTASQSDSDYDASTQSLSLSRAADILGVTTKTLRNWDEKGKINVIRTPGGHRRVPIKEISRLLAGEKIGMESEPKMEPLVLDNPDLETQETETNITPNEYLEFLKSFGLENIDFLKPEKTEMDLLPKEGLFDNLNRDQVNFLIRQLVHKIEDILGCRLTDGEYQKLANIVAIVHDRGAPPKDKNEAKSRPGVPSSKRGYALGYLINNAVLGDNQ